MSFFGQPARCDVAHTSLPIRPSKVRHSDIYLAPGGVHGTETKTSWAHICRRNGVDRPRGHDVGVGCADHVSDLPPSAFAFVLRPSASSPARIERRPIARRWAARPDLGDRWPSGLVATAAENLATQSAQSFAAASDCRTIAIYEYMRPSAWMCFALGAISQLRDLPRVRKACQRCLATSFRLTS